MEDKLPFVFEKNTIVINSGIFLSSGTGHHPKRLISSYELIFIRSGTLSIAEEDEYFELNEGDYLILYPGRVHYGTRDFDKTLSFYWVNFDILEKADMSMEFHLERFGHSSRPTVIIDLFNMLQSNQESGYSYEPVKQMLFALIICEMTRPKQDDESIGQSIVWASRAQAFIRTHFSEQITRNSIAFSIGCSADYLGRIFQKVYHKKISDMIHDNRIKRAGELLTSSARSVSDIAEECGYLDIRSFRLQFKLRYGITPQQYRSRNTR